MGIAAGHIQAADRQAARLLRSHMAASSRIVIYAALVGNLLIAVSKFFAAAVTSSSAMLSEGIHSLVDTGNEGLMLLGLRRAARPASPAYPFGHGKEVYFWSFIVAILVFALGAGFSLYEAYLHIRHPEPLHDVLASYIVLGVALLFEGASFSIALRAFAKRRAGRGYVAAVRASKDPTDFVVLLEDGAAILGVLVALAGITLAVGTANPIFDGIASLLIGLILAATASWLAYETQSLLIGESASGALVERIREEVENTRGVETLNELATIHMGPRFVLVTISAGFAGRMSADELETCIAGLTRRIKALDPSVRRVFIEAERGRDHRRELGGRS
jgi:cation diffusion facilitator family transporter